MQGRARSQVSSQTLGQLWPGFEQLLDQCRPLSCNPLAAAPGHKAASTAKHARVIRHELTQIFCNC